jgi:ubiquinone/menaquinone biosynthesis C-methylase UbiE
MREVASRASALAGLADRIEIRAGFMEDLPVESNSVDVLLSNGVINLSPDKEQVFREAFRVLKPGGRLFIADVAVERELKADVRQNPTLWAACIGGAMTETEFEQVSRLTGFVDGEVTHGFDCFRNTSAASKISSDLHLHGINFRAQKPKRHH